MKNLKLELFNFKKNLSMDQEEISRIVEGHMNACTENSEKSVILSLNDKLKPYTYDKDVKSFMEGLDNDMDEHNLLYELKHLYNVLNEKNQGELYRQPINVLLQTINSESDEDRMSMVLNELAIYDWVPEIKLFVHNLTSSPEQKSNLLSGGKSESVYTIVEQVEEGHITLIKDSWFLLKDDVIEKALLEDHIKDQDKLSSLRMIESALKYAEILDNKIEFRISENLTLGIGVNDKNLYINGDSMNEETTLGSLFSSPIIPIVNKNFYPVLEEVNKNLDSFVEMDVIKSVSNLANPYLECFAFNYKDNIYLYRVDERYGSSFFKYETATSIIEEVQNELNFDLTYFYEDKVGGESMKRRKLEDKEREVSLKLEEVKFNIEKVEGSIKVIGESEILNNALDKLKKREHNLSSEVQSIKELKYNEITKL